MSADKYPSIFSRQMATIVYIPNYLASDSLNTATILRAIVSNLLKMAPTEKKLPPD